MRRILLVLSVAALMAAMMTVMAVPALADPNPNRGPHNGVPPGFPWFAQGYDLQSLVSQHKALPLL